MSKIDFVLVDKDPEVTNLEYQKMKFEINTLASSLKHKHSVDSDVGVSIMSLLDVPFFNRKGRFGMDDPIYAVRCLVRKSNSLLPSGDDSWFDTLHIYNYWLSADCDDMTLVSHRKVKINLQQEKDRLDLRKASDAERRIQAAFKSAFLKLGELFADPNVSKPKGGK